MQFGFALAPVRAGYWLLTRTHLFKHPYDSKTHHCLVFEPAIVGGGLLIVSWVLASSRNVEWAIPWLSLGRTNG